MPKLPRVSGAEVVRALERLGFARVRRSGSHVVMHRESKGCVGAYAQRGQGGHAGWRAASSRSLARRIHAGGTTLTPNPSIERTSNGWLRHPLAAAYVKRWASSMP